MLSIYNYRTGVKPRTLARLYEAIGNGLAVFGAVSITFLAIDLLFFNGVGTTNLFIFLWEVTE
jgi:hypothetical protein